MSAQLKPHCWDTLITNALVFDGSGELPQQMDIAISQGEIVAKGLHLDTQLAHKVVNATGKWLMPGLMDIHTHMDLEIEIAPGMPEVVRHGTTSVLIGNCSLGISFGKQDDNGQNPIVDCFTRVENMPKTVLQKVIDKITWNNSADYLDHLDGVTLGANVIALLPHSMLRIEAMGLQNSVTRLPSDAELQSMERLLTDAIDEGYVGMSTDGLPFHYLAIRAPSNRPRQKALFAGSWDSLTENPKP
jgi:N-acyl-D-aspartate/D-glutamate deacylase